jgi:hypothetical protein
MVGSGGSDYGYSHGHSNCRAGRGHGQSSSMSLLVTSLSYLGIARLLVLMSRLYLYYRLAYSHLLDLSRT